MTSLLVHCCPGQKNTSKNVLGRFKKIRHRHTELKRCRSDYQSMFPTSFPKRNGPLHHPIWILSILVSRVSSRARSQQHIIKVLRHWRRNYGRNGRKCPRMWLVTLAGHFGGVFRLLLVIFDASSTCNWFEWKAYWITCFYTKFIFIL